MLCSAVFAGRVITIAERRKFIRLISWSRDESCSGYKVQFSGYSISPFTEYLFPFNPSEVSSGLIQLADVRQENFHFTKLESK